MTDLAINFAVPLWWIIYVLAYLCIGLLLALIFQSASRERESVGVCLALIFLWPVALLVLFVVFAAKLFSPF